MFSKEAFLERKIECLERRLTRIEKFVEIRFNASLDEQDPGSLKNSRKDDVDSDTSTKKKALPSKLKVKPPQTLKRPRGRPKSASSKRLAVQEAIPEKHKPLIKECFVKIVNDTNLTSRTTTLSSKSKVESRSTPSSNSNPYGTRSQKKIEAEASSSSIAEVKQEVECADDLDVDLCDDDPGVGTAADAWQDDHDDQSSPNASILKDPKAIKTYIYVPVDHEYDVTPSDLRDEGGQYFTFPPDDNESRDNISDDPDFEVEEKPSRLKHKPKRKRGRPKGPNTGKKKKKWDYNYRFGSISMKNLSEAKLLSTDPNRGECPVCHTHIVHDLLPSHIATHARERTIHCPHCDKKFFKQETLKKHVLTIHDIDNYKRKCRNCSKPIIGNMLHHEQYCVRKAVEDDKEVDPKLIEDIQKRLRRLGRDLELPDKSKQVDPNERRTCPVCKKVFSMLYYERHVKSHDKARNWKCTKCSKAYIHKHDLIRHMILTHENIPTCQACNATFDTRAALHMHSIKVCKGRKRKKRAKKTEKDDTTEDDEENSESEKATTSKSSTTPIAPTPTKSDNPEAIDQGFIAVSNTTPVTPTPTKSGNPEAVIEAKDQGFIAESNTTPITPTPTKSDNPEAVTVYQEFILVSNSNITSITQTPTKSDNPEAIETNGQEFIAECNAIPITPNQSNNAETADQESIAESVTLEICDVGTWFQPDDAAVVAAALEEILATLENPNRLD